MYLEQYLQNSKNATLLKTKVSWVGFGAIECREWGQPPYLINNLGSILECSEMPVLQ